MTTSPRDLEMVGVTVRGMTHTENHDRYRLLPSLGSIVVLDGVTPDAEQAGAGYVDQAARGLASAIGVKPVDEAIFAAHADLQRQHLRAAVIVGQVRGPLIRYWWVGDCSAWRLTRDGPQSVAGGPVRSETPVFLGSAGPPDCGFTDMVLRIGEQHLVCSDGVSASSDVVSRLLRLRDLSRAPEVLGVGASDDATAVLLRRAR